MTDELDNDFEPGNDNPTLTDEALPREVTSLRFIPEEKRVCYSRTMSGGFRLSHVFLDDMKTREAYLEDVAARKFKFLRAGETPASQAAAEKETERQREAVLAMTAKREADDKAELEREQARRRDENAQPRWR